MMFHESRGEGTLYRGQPQGAFSLYFAAAGSKSAVSASEKRFGISKAWFHKRDGNARILDAPSKVVHMFGRMPPQVQGPAPESSPTASDDSSLWTVHYKAGV